MNEKFLFWCLVALNFLDACLTAAIISNGGAEANPYVQLYLTQFGLVGLLVAKIPPLAVLGIVIYTRWNQLRVSWQHSVRGILLALDVVLSGVVVYSVGIYLNLIQ